VAQAVRDFDVHENVRRKWLREFDLLPISRTNLKLAKSVNHQENDGHREQQIH